ncbi:MAG TPA: enolase C-terminal domain-like protein [Limnochordales bacterium]|nr:enolase C-terminal domain-like protein [Limnochordales bacterium]
MRIRRVEAVVRTVSSRTLSTAYGAGVSRRTHAFVRVETDTGMDGIGEASPLPHFTGEAAETIAWVIREKFGPALAGVDPWDLEAVHAALDRTLPHHTTAKHAVVTAVWDLISKAAGLPAGYLMGGRRAEALPVVGGLGIADIDETVRQAVEQVQQGLRTLKLKIGTNPKRDKDAVAAVRDAVGPDIALRVDANQHYTVKEAIQLIRSLEPFDVQYVEQPIRAGDPRELARVTQATGLRIAADESLYGPREALALLREQAADVLVVKLIKCGGPYRGRQLLAMAEAAGLPCVLVSPYETTVGAAANLHLAAAAPNVPFAVEVGVFAIPDDPARGVVIEQGQAHIPKGPGLGIAVDPDLFAMREARHP